MQIEAIACLSAFNRYFPSPKPLGLHVVAVWTQRTLASDSARGADLTWKMLHTNIHVAEDALQVPVRARIVPL